MEQVFDATDGWPRDIDGVTFAQVDGRVLPLEKPSDLFGWLDGHCAVEWTNGTVTGQQGARIQPVNKTELFSVLRSAIPDEHRYKHVETLPHEPRMPNVFYIDKPLPDPTGKALDEFVSLFNGDSDLDNLLIRALIISGMWGGPTGVRPAFIIKSDYGRGAGKSSTAQAIAQVYGGSIDVDPNGDWGTTITRLLDPGTVDKRFVLVDNLKAGMYSSRIESTITADVISGKRMYFGNGERVNNLIWMFTANSPETSTDLASRAVIIKIGEPAHDVDFKGQVRDFLERRRDHLLADIMAELRGPKRGAISTVDRFNPWQRAVLGTMPEAEALAQLIAERRLEVDADRPKALAIAARIQDVLRNRDLDPREACVRIPSHELLRIVREVEANDRINERRMWTILNGVLTIEPLQRSCHAANAQDGSRILLWRGKWVSDDEHPINLPAIPEWNKPGDDVASGGKTIVPPY